VTYAKVLFRDLVSEIPSTTYVTHGLYPYPAKFIPHVVRFVLEKFTKRGDWVFDPFAGYGTVAIECSLCNRNCILWDLNPMLDIFVKASTYQHRLTIEDFRINWKYKEEYHPKWDNIHYWHPKEFYDVLVKVWGYWHYEVEPKLKPIVAIPLLRVTRFFSYSDEKISKLYKSKYAVKKVKDLLSTDWKFKMEKMYWYWAKNTYNKIRDYQRLNPKQIECVVKTGIDTIEEILDKEVEILLTSPPYLQAQEYIRSFKLELAWLGYGTKEIRDLQRKEIPYNSPPNVDVLSETYDKYREEVERLNHKKLLMIYESYFKSLAYFLNRNHEKVRKYIAIFVGPVKIRTITIPIDEILKEHLENLGWKHEITYIDTIVSRRLFKTSVNPASGLPDRRTQTEHLLVMKR
jgi:hypothetical protein